MHVGHINLAASTDGSGEYFVPLIEALHRTGLRQYVLVRETCLATRIAAIDGVEVGPIVHSPVTACCLMPRVDVMHAHDPAAGRTGLLLTLTRSIPYVLTHRATTRLSRNRLLQAVYRRAAAVLCQDECEVAMIRHGLPGLSVEIIPDIDGNGLAGAYLRLYQNSQRIPIAGSKGIQ